VKNYKVGKTNNFKKFYSGTLSAPEKEKETLSTRTALHGGVKYY